MGRTFISGAGQFFDEITQIPRFHNLMTVVQTGGKLGCYWRTGMHARSGAS